MDNAMENCIFCKIARGEIPAEVVWKDEHVLVFKDIHPATPKHFLAIPLEHIPTVNDADANNAAILGRLFVAAAETAKKFGFAESGYRCVVNCNRDAGQELFHLHMHIMAGKKFGWPPG